MTDQWDVFIAHASPDKVVARELFLRLQDRCRVYFDEVSTQLGRPWPKNIADAHRSSRCTVVLVSPATGGSHYQQDEIVAAIALSRRDDADHLVVPVYLDDVAASDPPYGLGIMHGVTLGATTSLNDVAEHVLAAIGRHEASDAHGRREQRLRVVYADDNLPMRKGIAALLDDENDVDLVDSCTDLDSLLASVDRLSPDVVITDLRMPPTGSDEGIVAANRIRETHPQVAVIVLSNYADPECARALVADGSERRGYLLKERISEPDSLISAIKAVARGTSCIDPDIISSLLNSRSRSRALDPLTQRERDVLSELASGLSNQAIARKLIVSERAVEKHINSIFTKLDLFHSADANRRVQAALLFLATTSR